MKAIVRSTPRKFLPWAILLVFMSGFTPHGCAVTGHGTRRHWECDETADLAVRQERWDIAFKEHEKLLEEEPDNGLTWYHLGYIAGKMGDRDQEAACYQKAVSLGYETEHVFFNLGMVWGELKQVHKAREAFERAMALNPESAEPCFGLGLVALSVGDHELAETSLARAVALQPDYSEARKALAGVYLAISRWKEARTHIDILVKEDPEDPETINLVRTLMFRQSVAFEK